MLPAWRHWGVHQPSVSLYSRCHFLVHWFCINWRLGFFIALTGLLHLRLTFEWSYLIQKHILALEPVWSFIAFCDFFPPTYSFSLLWATIPSCICETSCSTGSFSFSIGSSEHDRRLSVETVKCRQGLQEQMIVYSHHNCFILMCVGACGTLTAFLIPYVHS